MNTLINTFLILIIVTFYSTDIYANSAGGHFADIAGGKDNIADGDYSAVLGGKDNSVYGLGSSILGGENNIIFCQYKI